MYFVLLFMLMYLVLFAALAPKMRSSTFQWTNCKVRLETRQILDKYFTSFATLGLALSSALSMSPGEVLYTQSMGDGS